ncbi:MAG: DUF3530 family protein [Arenicellales bacterium]
MRYMSVIRVFATYGLVFLLAIGFVSAQAQTFSDTDKETRWAEQVSETLFDGEVVWLLAGQHEFLAIEMRPDSGAVKNAVIVVHGIGVHPNWEQVIRPVRVQMAEAGWVTFSIQMPILPNEATALEYQPLFDEVPARFSAAIRFLKENGAENIVIVSHSLGAAMSAWYLAQADSGDISALVVIGMNAQTSSMPVDTARAIRKVQIPILDIYGGEDLEAVISTSARRASAAYTGGNPDYRQIRIDEANHFFDGQENQLVELILSWLEKRGN